MAMVKTEIFVQIGNCKCCLNDRELKNMWEPYIHDGETEIYGDMLTECFALPWEQPISSQYPEQICEICIARLREAIAFRREILVSEELLQEHREQLHLGKDLLIRVVKDEEQNKPDSIKVEEYLKAHDETEFQDVEYLEIDELIDNRPRNGTFLEERSSEMPDKRLSKTVTEDVTCLEYESNLMQPMKRQHQKVKAKHQYNVTQDEQLENSEISIELKKHTTNGRIRVRSNIYDHETVDVSQDSSASDVSRYAKRRGKMEQDNEEGRKTKWPKKLKRADRNKTYKQYSTDDLKKAIEAVQTNVMTSTQASLTFKVPRKTLTAKLRSCANQDNDNNEASKNIDYKKHLKLIEEIKTILTYTNAIPYKSKTSRYFCAYCSTDGSYFEEPDDLRTHTRTKHAEDRTRSIEMMMRPQWVNEVIKMDIDSLHCTVCCTILLTWNDMFTHLEEKHQVVLDEAYTRVIPYILSRELKCALCFQSFSNYGLLDGHMNAHYSNYICFECGDTFLAETRLKKHVEVHNTGRFPCEACGKVFSLKKYLKKHFDNVHGNKENIKCLYCTEKFTGTLQRHLHVMEKHKEKVKIIACEYCGKTFHWKPYYNAHLRKRHGSEVEKTYRCDDCDKTFLMKYELKNHQIKHSIEKRHICAICDKRFKSKPGLKRHVLMHSESTL